MEVVAKRLTSPLLTSRDSKVYFRILHRSWATRNMYDAAHSECRLCHGCPERFSHLARCPILRQVFALFVNFARKFNIQVDLNEELIWLGLTRGGALPGALSALHVILWKFVGIALVRVETEHAPFEPELIWGSAVSRYCVRLMAYEEGIRRWVNMREGWGDLGIPPQVSDRHNTVLNPVASLTETGAVEYDGRYLDLLTHISTKRHNK